MSGLWGYFWPVFAVALALGAGAGLVAFQPARVTDSNRMSGTDAILRGWRRKRRLAIGAGLVAALAAAALWHGPLGAAGRLSTEIERNARQTLVAFEVPHVQARLHRRLLSRRLVLSGRADDFQRGRLVEIMGAQPGVTSAGWSDRAGGLPLIVEAMLAAAAAFGLGLVLAYVVELRRRVTREWRW